MFSVCVVKHLLERGIIVVPVLEEPLLGELLLGQGLCEGLDISLHEAVVLRTTVLLLVLMEVKGQQELLEIEGELREKELGWNGELKVDE